MTQILKPPKKPRTKRVSFAGGFLPWQDPGGLRTEVIPTPRRRQLSCHLGGSAVGYRIPRPHLRIKSAILGGMLLQSPQVSLQML